MLAVLREDEGLFYDIMSGVYIYVHIAEESYYYT